MRRNSANSQLLALSRTTGKGLTLVWNYRALFLLDTDARSGNVSGSWVGISSRMDTNSRQDRSKNGGSDGLAHYEVRIFDKLYGF